MGWMEGLQVWDPLARHCTTRRQSRSNRRPSRLVAAFYDEPPLPAQTDSKADWPAGALLPDIGVMRKWTWKTLQAAREELQLAVESVMEDLEGLSASSCNSSTVQVTRAPPPPPPHPHPAAPQPDTPSSNEPRRPRVGLAVREPELSSRNGAVCSAAW